MLDECLESRPKFLYFVYTHFVLDWKVWEIHGVNKELKGTGGTP